MLRTIKKFYKIGKPFYGINCGTIGFLMNKFNNISLHKRINKTKIFSINPIEAKVLNFKRRISKMLAVNEISLLRQSKQTAILKLQVNKNNLIKKLICDGVLVSTPAGSTAYNLSVNGPILSLNSKKIVITPISPLDQEDGRKLISDKSKTIIQNIEATKRPVSVVADNYEVRNIKKIEVKVNKKIKINLLLDRE